MLVELFKHALNGPVDKLATVHIFDIISVDLIQRVDEQFDELVEFLVLFIVRGSSQLYPYYRRPREARWKACRCRRLSIEPDPLREAAQKCDD